MNNLGWECPRCHACMNPSLFSCVNCKGTDLSYNAQDCKQAEPFRPAVCPFCSEVHPGFGCPAKSVKSDAPF